MLLRRYEMKDPTRKVAVWGTQVRQGSSLVGEFDEGETVDREGEGQVTSFEREGFRRGEGGLVVELADLVDGWVARAAHALVGGHRVAMVLVDAGDEGAMRLDVAQFEIDGARRARHIRRRKVPNSDGKRAIVATSDQNV